MFIDAYVIKDIYGGCLEGVPPNLTVDESIAAGKKIWGDARKLTIFPHNGERFQVIIWVDTEIIKDTTADGSAAHIVYYTNNVFDKSPKSIMEEIMLIPGYSWMEISEDFGY